MTDLQIDRRHSVTKGDQIDGTNGGVFVWNVYDGLGPRSPAGLPPHWSPARDAVLRGTVDLEDMWASSVNQALTKYAARNFEVSDSDDSERRTTNGQELLLDFDGPAQYTSALAKHLQDFTTTDNGAFVEIERVSRSGGRPVALWHLDSARCRRTGNLQYPVIYTGFDGVERALRYDQVMMVADMPSPRVGLWGVGRCAASRAWYTIIKLAAVETYFREKITGSGALALHFISGVNPQQLADAVQTSDAEQQRKGRTVYKGAVMVPVLGDRVITVATVDLASIPDRFDVDLERKDAYLRYANALGIPVQDIQPLSGQGLGTGTQTVILDEAAEGKGLAFWRAWFERTINRLVLPKTTTFSFSTNDLRDKKAKADVENVTATMIATLLEKGVISQQQAINMLADAGIVPQEFLQSDLTQGGMLTDTGEGSKPVDAITSAVSGLLQAPQPTPVVTKAKRLSVAELDDEVAIAAARKLVDEVRNG